MSTVQSPPAAGRIAFAYPDFRAFQAARLISVVGLEMQSVAVGWRIYEITRRPLDLGLAGLAQFLPGIILFLLSGHTADRVDRRKLLTVCYAAYALCSGILIAAAVASPRSVGLIYAALVLAGTVSAFSGPASRAILPQLVPDEHFPNAVAWNATVFQIASLSGPALGGLIYAIFQGPMPVYVMAALAAVSAVVLTGRMRVKTSSRTPETLSSKSVLAGLRYISRNRILLGSMSLDLFAVLFGGAVALLPVYAREVLNTGPRGLGLLRSAPAIGAVAMALILAHRPLRGRMGIILFSCVGGFGVFTIVFGISRSLTLSLLALLMAGAFDMVSVIIRNMLVQMSTPDAMRGRVTAVELIFIGASNEFGQFESGVTAQWFGTIPAVILGGVASLVVTVLWASTFPELRKTDQIAGPEPIE